MSAPPTNTLVAKLAEVMKAVESVPKRGHNSFHNYDYATEADIVSAIRVELANRHVMLLPAVTGRTREAVGEKGSVLTHLDMEFTFIDGESGETLTRPWLGAGTDKEDKGAYKAMTGGEKYFLLKTFLIPTGDDPEQERQDRSQKTQRRAQRNDGPHGERQPSAPSSGGGSNGSAYISSEQQKRLIGAAREAGWTGEEMARWLKSSGYNGWNKVPAADFSKVLTTLETGGVSEESVA